MAARAIARARSVASTSSTSSSTASRARASARRVVSAARRRGASGRVGERARLKTPVTTRASEEESTTVVETTTIVRDLAETSATETTTTTAVMRRGKGGDGGAPRRAGAERGAERVIFGVPMSPEVYAIALVYFVQGVIGLSRLAKDFYLKDELHLDPSQTALILSISQAPWLIKPLWGFLSDSVPLFGYKRKSYLMLCGLIGCLGWSSMATWVDAPETAVVAFTLGSLSIAFSDVLIDSIVVAKARGEEQGLSGSLQSLCWGSVAVGSIVSSYFSGSLIESYGTRFVFGATALFPLMIAGASTLVDEQPMDKSRKISREGIVGDFKEMTGTIFQVAKRRDVWAPAFFVYLLSATPSAGSAMFYFNTNELGFSPEFLGRIALLRAFAALGGVALYNGYLKRVPLKKMFFWTTILGTALSSTQLLLVTRMNLELGISDKLFALTDTAVLTVLGEVSFLPVLVLAAKICPEGVEATFFAALMSLFNAGGVTSEFLGAGLTKYLGVTADNFDNLFLLLTICLGTGLLPLFALNLIDEVSDDDVEGGDGDDIESGVKTA